ncbi:unnamed protein product [Trichobilharzia regenti]|uniref:Uncharacterized protein n=1 Tax=Trichobilharzia regenti TaxID=157069 RepID=A0A183W7B2_TRIRE|nr:unnamed protein product [Trichobilharzia regenti]VDQ03957.1 unnamed protein product [Trichobilharzia regenti]
MLHRYMLAFIYFIFFIYIHHINANDDNVVSFKEMPTRLSPVLRNHIMKRNYLWDARLGKRSMNTMNRDSLPWYKSMRDPYPNDDNYFGGYPGHDD